MMKKYYTIFMMFMFALIVSAQTINPIASAILIREQSSRFKFYNISSEKTPQYSAQVNAIEQGQGLWSSPMYLFNNQNFGSHTANSGALTLLGGEVKTIRSIETNNVCSPKLYFKVNALTTGVNGVLESTKLKYFAGCEENRFADLVGGPCVSNPAGLANEEWQKWQNSELNLDLTHRLEGNYELEVYLEIIGNNFGQTGCDPIAYINNGGSNYKAAFTICPNYISKEVNCGSNMEIVLTIAGIEEGTYSNRFFYDENSTFKNVVVATNNGVTTATISQDALGDSLTSTTYNNVRYINPVFSGCESIINEDITIVSDAPPSVPTLDAIDCTLGFNNAKVTVASPLGVGYMYSIDGGVYQDNTVFSEVANGSHTVTVKNSNGCSTSTASFSVSCGCVGAPIVSLSSATGSTCDVTPVEITGNIFGGSATQVIIIHNGSGTLNQTVSSVSPFDIIYTPTTSDLGKVVTITVTTNNNNGEPCVVATSNYELSVHAEEGNTCLGVSDFDFNQELALYPNPVQDQLYITSKSSTKVLSLEIYNLQGQLIQSVPEVTKMSFDVSRLLKGTYVVKVKTDKGIEVSKMVKE